MQSNEVYTPINEFSTSLDDALNIIPVACIALILPWVTTALRLYVRIGIKKLLGIDDYFAISSLLILTTLCALLIKNCQYFGPNDYLPKLSATRLTDISLVTFASEILYILTTTLTKFSFAFYFLRLTRRKYQRRILYLTVAIVTIISAIYFFYILLQCQPVSYLWRQFHRPKISGSCQSTQRILDLTYTHAVMSFVIDLIYGISPILIVMRIDVGLKTKLSVMFVLSLSLFASVPTIIRIIYIHDISSNLGLTGKEMSLIKWSILEPAIVLTASALTTVRPLLQKIHPSNQLTYISTLYSNDEINPRHSVIFTGEFAGMLGLEVSPGVRTHIYATSSQEDLHSSRNISKKRWGDCNIFRSLRIRNRTDSEVKESSSIQFSSCDSARKLSLGLGNINSGIWKPSRPIRGITTTTVITRKVLG